MRTQGTLARAVIIGMLALGPETAAGANTAPPLVLESTIALPETSGRIDHLAIDLGRGRLFVAELGNGSVDVVDLHEKRVMRRLSSLHDPQGVLYLPAADLIAVASAGDGTLRLFRGTDYAPQGVIKLGDDADNIRLGLDRRGAVVGYGRGGLALIEPAAGTVRAKIALGAHPEGFQLAPEGRAYVNVPDGGGIEVADLATGKVIQRWTFPGLSENFPMALGEVGVVAVVFRTPARLVRIDQATGHEMSRSDACRDADDVSYDASRRRYYISCGEGAVDVFEVVGNAVRKLQPIVTSRGARTSLFVPELDRLFVAVRAGLLGSQAEIRVMRPTP